MFELLRDGGGPYRRNLDCNGYASQNAHYRVGLDTSTCLLRQSRPNSRDAYTFLASRWLEHVGTRNVQSIYKELSLALGNSEAESGA